MNNYYALNEQGQKVNIYIFGDIVETEQFESDVSANTLVQKLQSIETGEIDVHINSYGGSVASGLAIYNTLKNHKAKVRTICDGFACSAASVIFMAGDERIMNAASLLMIHNAWMWTAGNAAQLRKDADDLDMINQSTAAAYMEHINITEDELKALLDAETWITPEDALSKGFATAIINAETKTDKAAASARQAVYNKMLAAVAPPVPQSAPQPVIPTSPDARTLVAASSEPEPPQENKILKFFNALKGREE